MRVLLQSLAKKAKFANVMPAAVRPMSVAQFNDYAFLHSNLKNQSFPKHHSGSRAFSSDATMTLVDMLSKEYEEEVDSGNTEIPKELAELKASLEEDWRLVDDGASTQLFLKNKKVQISWHCQDTVEEVAQEEMAMEGDDEEEPALPVHFTVTVSKAGKSLVFDCLSDYGEAKVVGVRTTSSDVADEENLYQGPDFVELDEGLQEAFAIYLEEELSINSDVAAFIAMYSDYKEQMQYVQFLKDAQSIVA